ncbi:MAG: hypothetical protein ABSA48_15920 [Terracidiphilus sp.]
MPHPSRLRSCRLSIPHPSDEVGAGVPFRAGASLHPGERWADLTKAFGYPAPLARV